MVNRGASRGCIICLQRHTKCDEGKPLCMQCLQLGHECKGYGKRSLRVRFKDETARYFGTPPAKETGISKGNHRPATITSKRKPPPTTRHNYTILPSLTVRQQDLAVPFFLNYVTNIGRSLESTRGFLEFVRPVLATEHHDSALFTTVNASAAKLWTLLGNYGPSDQLPIQLHSRALVRLQKAVQDPEERQHDATVLAALMLQVYDTLSAISGQQKAHGTHRDGALALLLKRGDGVLGSKYHANLVGNLLHSKAFLCIRERRPLPPGEVEWLKIQGIPTAPLNLSSLLDHVGISIANLQHTFYESWASRNDLSSYGSGDLSDKIRDVDTQLRKWVEAVPQHWYPNRVQSGKDIDTSVDTYQGACDVYPSIQIANIWNGWRIYCLILQQITFRLLIQSQELTAQDDDDIGNMIVRAQHADEVQELVDSICCSVLFYLGNCTSPPMLSDMENPNIIFPSYHDLPQSDEAYLRYHTSDHYVSRVDHSRHILLQGHLHCMIILSHLLGSFPGQPSLVAAQALRQGQKQWMAKKFLRSLYLLRRIPQSSLYDTGCQGSGAQSQRMETGVAQAETLARTVRKGLWTVNIL